MGLVLGLTGGVASGKSTVAAIFFELGVRLIDTDQIAHALSQPGQACALAVASLFGTDYLDEQGAIARAKLRQLVFSDGQARQQLDRALHPLIYTEACRQLALPHASPYTLLAVPLLFENPMFVGLVARTLLVDCPETTQLRRLMARSGLSQAQAQAIIDAQMSRAQRQEKADDLLYNDGDLEHLHEQVLRQHQIYLQIA